MRLSAFVEKEWEERYVVHESRFNQGGFWTRPTLTVVAQKDEDNSQIHHIPYSRVTVQYEKNREEAKLTLKKRIVSGKEIDAFKYNADYRQTELVSADFEVPEGYKLLGLEEKVEDRGDTK